MANLFSKLQVSNKPHKGSFDLSYRNIVACEFGQLIPFDIRECVPSDHFRLSTSTFTRTKPLVSAAYTRFREHIDYYFVPYRLLWRFSDSLFTSTPISNTSYSSDQGQARISDYTPYVDGAGLESIINFLQDPHPIFVGNSSKAKLLDDGGLSCSATTAQLLTLLGYGDWFNAPVWNFRLPRMSLFRALAYQKIYQDFYRNDQWENINPSSFNVDYLTPYNSVAYPVNKVFKESNIDNVRANNPFGMRYANFPRDIFTGLLPKQQFGPSVYAKVDNDFVGSFANVSFYLQGQSGGSPNVVAHNGSLETTEPEQTDVNLMFRYEDGTDNPIKGLSILNLRYAQALQKYYEITQSHKYNYKSQIKAHFNINVSDDRSDVCKYLGGKVSTFSLNEVTNTNLTGDNNAVIQSNGVSSSDCNIDFISREHGIIMGIYYAEPLLDYSSHISQHNLKLSSDDFFKPEFDSLGLQPANVYGLTDTDFADEYFTKVKSSTLGYLPRYYEYKLPQDIVDSSASFAFPQWLIPARFREIFKDAFNRPYLRVNYRSFKIRPSLLNPIFGVQVTESSGVESYRLLCCFSNNCVAVRPMSESGMPY